MNPELAAKLANLFLVHLTQGRHAARREWDALSWEEAEICVEATGLFSGSVSTFWYGPE